MSNRPVVLDDELTEEPLLPPTPEPRQRRPKSLTLSEEQEEANEVSTRPTSDEAQLRQKPLRSSLERIDEAVQLLSTKPDVVGNNDPAIDHLQAAPTKKNATTPLRENPLTMQPPTVVVVDVDKQIDDDCKQQDDNCNDKEEEDCTSDNSADIRCDLSVQRVRSILRMPTNIADDAEAFDEALSNTPPCFCELVQLRYNRHGRDYEWKQTHRWVKFEEQVDRGKRWSKPFVSSLSMSALLELRAFLHSSSLLLDVSCASLEQLYEKIVDTWIEDGSLGVHERNVTLDVLNRRIRHQHEASDVKLAVPSLLQTSPQFLEAFGRRSGSNAERSPITPDAPSGSSPSHTTTTIGSSFAVATPSKSPTTATWSGKSPMSTITRGQQQQQPNYAFRKKLPASCESITILVGACEFLHDRSQFAFVRLHHPRLLERLNEVDLPTRFVCVLLVPVSRRRQASQIGRSVGGLFTDLLFRSVCYQAQQRLDMLFGIDEFINAVTVLPPGVWDPSIRLEPPGDTPSQMGRLVSSSFSTHAPPPPGAGELSAVAAVKTGTNGHTLSAAHAQPHAAISRHSESEFGLPPGAAAAHSHVNDPALQFTGRFCGGLVADIKRRYRYYVSDFTDGLSPQSIGTILFLFFANFTPLIAFGGLLGDITGGQMAAFESVLGGGFTGIIWSLFSGQPLVLMSSTGPVLVFEQIVFDFCTRNGLEYMSFRVWIGLWTTFLLLVMVVTDASALVKYITRFTEETFATLIAVVFIIQALQNLLHTTDHYGVLRHPPPSYGVVLDECHCDVVSADANRTWLRTEETMSREACKHLHQFDRSVYGVLRGRGCDYVPDVFFFSVVLFFGTFLVAKTLKSFRTTSFFPTKIRVAISDFGVVIAILVWTLVDMWCGISTPKLEVPSEFKPTSRENWFINPFPAGLLWWAIPVALVPALLGTILIFLDQHITAVIVNRPENKMRKGYGYHLDLFVLAVSIAVCSLFGLPWMVATTVQSMSHVDSLRLESESSAPGERPQFLGTREQRLTNLGISLLIAMSVFLTPVLRHIPMAVLYGVFFYMGISILRSIQFVDRLALFFKPKKYQPDRPYIRHVQLYRIHLFTLVELLSLVAVCSMKYIKQTAMFFPVMILALVFIRKILTRVFTPYELYFLDDIMPEFKFGSWCFNSKKRRNHSTSTLGLDAAAVTSASQQLTAEKFNALHHFDKNGDQNVGVRASLLNENAIISSENEKFIKPSQRARTASIVIVPDDEEENVTRGGEDDNSEDEAVLTAAIHDHNAVVQNSQAGLGYIDSGRRPSEDNAAKPRQRKTSKRYSLRSAPHYSSTNSNSVSIPIPPLAERNISVNENLDPVAIRSLLDEHSTER